MPCRVVKIGDTFAIVKFAPEKRRRCSVCGDLTTVVLCDFVLEGQALLFGEPGAKSRTCDAPLCKRCAIHIPPDTDFCPDHRPRPCQHEDRGASSE